MLRILAMTTMLFTLASQAPAADESTDSPATGETSPAFAPFDEWMKKFLQDHKVPGGSLAIVRDGKVVYARGFGLADREKKTPVQPESLFRIASISKPITAVAVLKLVEEGRLKTSDKILDILKYEPHFEGDAKFDERWNDVTIAQCLAHTGGWDRGVSYDPMFQAQRMAKSMKINLPILPVAVYLCLFPAIIAYFVLMVWRYGAVLRGFGANPRAIEAAGWSMLLAKATLFGFAGLFALLAGIVVTASTRGGDPVGAVSMTLLSVAAVVLGGASFTGGIVSPVGALFGVLTLVLVGTLLSLLGVDGVYLPMVQGILLLGVVGVRTVLVRRQT